MERRNWTREELILAINLYCKIPFGKINKNNPEVIHLAKLIGRTPSSISFKLGNFGSFDPSLKERGVGGLPNAGKLDKEIWDEFYQNWEERTFESERLRAKFEKKSLEQFVDLSDMNFPEGKARDAIVKIRVNQSFFRSTVLASYSFACCITGIKNTDLLIASHIVPWAEDSANRLNPRNGICLNALHDRAFDKYLITITPDFKLKLSKKLKSDLKNKSIQENFLQFESQEIKLPQKFIPDEKLLLHHNKIFSERNDSN
jgi:putative restriction endonuclease